MVNTIYFKGEQRPVSLNLYALRLIEQETGKKFHEFFQDIAAKGQSQDTSMMFDVSTLLFAAMKGGAVATGTQFDFTKEDVEASIDLANMEEMMTNAIGMMQGAMPGAKTDKEGSAKKKAGVVKIPRHLPSTNLKK